jgi:hypothetical protein
MSLRAASALVSVLAVCVAMATAPSTRAASDPVASGKTVLSLDKRFLAFAERHGVTVAVRGGALRRAGRLLLPISGGSADPTLGTGTVEHDGAVLFRRGAAVLPWRRLEVQMGRVPLRAKVGGGQLRLARAQRTGAGRAGFGTRFTARGLTLTAKLATRLNKKLGLRSRPFQGGQPFASLRTVAQPLTATVLPRGRATVTLDPGFLAKLSSLFVSVNPIFPAELVPGSPLLTVPLLARSALAPSAALGVLRTGGAIEFLQLGSGQIFWTEPWFDFGAAATLAEADIEPAPTYPGKVGQLPLLSLAPGAVGSDPKGRTITVSGAPLILNATAAAHFNLAFAGGAELFHAGEPFGSVSFTVQAQ